jgi:hypothetical protein
MEAPNRLALQLNSEIAAVITAMRQNAKWAVVPGKYNVRVPTAKKYSVPPTLAHNTWTKRCRRRIIWSLSPILKIFVASGARFSNGKVTTLDARPFSFPTANKATIDTSVRPQSSSMQICINLSQIMAFSCIPVAQIGQQFTLWST